MSSGPGGIFLATSPLYISPSWTLADINYSLLMSSSHQGQGEGSRSQGEDWKKITDQSERRKIQNRNAQRKFSEYIHPT